MKTDDRVTAKQAEVLRLVRLHKTSKEIGQILGISHYTVDKHIQTACRTLGVESRREAAFLLYADSPPEPLVTQSFGIAIDPDSKPHPEAQRGPVSTLVSVTARQNRQPWDTTGFGSDTLGALRGVGERTRRSVLIVILSLLILAFGTLFLTVLRSLTEFVRQM